MKMRLGLALGGGGARGAVHVGVLRELDARGIRPDLISGASIGAVVGAFYAAGLTPDDMDHLLEQLDVSQVFSLAVREPAVTNNTKIRQLLRDALGEIQFEDLAIPLSVVATDLVSRKLIVLDRGELLDALVAAITLPVVLPPVEIGDMVLVDGGMLNNLPFDVARARGATYVIAVDLSNSAPFGTVPDADKAKKGVIGRALAVTQRNKLWQVLSTTIDVITTQSVNTHLALSQPDLYLKPYVGTVGLFDFHRWQECDEIGREAARAVGDALDELARRQRA